MNITVYGAASNNIDEQYINNGIELGKEMAKRGYTLVFGGGATGLMGAVSKGVHINGGHVIGISPTFFKEVDGALYDGCDEMIYTNTMRERKQLLEDKADAFIMTPGGIGTFEEFFEVLTLKQLGRHHKAIVIFNDKGYYNHMLEMLEHTIKEGFMKENNKELYYSSDNIEDVLNYIEKYNVKENKNYRSI